MRKKITYIIFVVVLALVAAVSIAAHFMPGKVKEKGGIKNAPDIGSEEFYHKNDEVNDMNLYKDLSKYIYKGEVSYRTLYFEFADPDANTSPVYMPCECSVYESDENDINYADTTRTVYEVKITDDTLELIYIAGPEKATYKCEYKGGELTVNGTRMEKIDPKNAFNRFYAGSGE